MSADNCWKIFQNKLKEIGDVIDDSYRARLENDYNRLQQDLATQNRQLEDVNPETGNTYLDDFLENINIEPNKKQLENINAGTIEMKNVIEFNRQIQDTYENLKIVYKGDKKFTGQKLLQEAIIAHIYNTNFTYNTNPLEMLIRNESQILDANFRRQAQDILGSDNDRSFFDFFSGSNKQNQIDFLQEYSNIINNPTAKNLKAVTGNTQARDIARAFVDNVVVDAEVKMNRYGGRTNALTRNRLKVRFNKNKMEKVTRDEFIKDLTPRLSNDVHGTTENIQDMVGDIYDKIMDGANWRQIDDIVKDYQNTDKSIPKSLTYKSGQDIFDLSQKYTPDQNPLNLMLNTITENGRLLALTEKFGANYHRTIQELKTSLSSELKGQKTAGFNSAMNFLEESINPQIKEQFGTAARTFTSLRAIEAGARLGSAAITSFMDIPVVIWAGRNIFKLPGAELISSIFRVPVYKNLDKTKVRNYQLMTHDFAQAWLANSGERFGMIDVGGAMSRFERGSYNFATKIFKYSGLNWWTESLQKATGTVYQKYLGRIIKEKRAWNSLDLDFRSQFEKFGINKADYEKLINTRNIVDSDGGLNLYALKDELSTGKGIQSKMISVVRDAVDTMVIKPSEFDKSAGRIFLADDGGPGSQFIKLITQFKTHPITYTRKVIWRNFLRKKAVRDNNGQLVDALDKINNIWPAVTLAGSMITMGVVVAQLKEITAGKAPLTDPGELAYRSIQQSGVAGLISDLLVSVAEPAIKQFSTDKKIRVSTTGEMAQQFVGPLAGDALKLMSNIMGIGTGAARFATGVDDGEFIKKELSKTGKNLLGYTGLQSLWITKALYRALITEYLTEVLDYKTYLRTQKRLKRDAREKRLGGELNIIDLFN